jgi:hypothetical protein
LKETKVRFYSETEKSAEKGKNKDKNHQKSDKGQNKRTL